MNFRRSYNLLAEIEKSVESNDSDVLSAIDESKHEQSKNRIDLYENTEHQTKIKAYYKSLNTSKLLEITNHKYKYKKDFDKNGIIYALGIDFDFITKDNKRWQN
eukprot:428985_1